MIIGIGIDIFDKTNKTKEQQMEINKLQIYSMLSNEFKRDDTGNIIDMRQVRHAKAYSKQVAGYELTKEELNDIEVWEKILDDSKNYVYSAL